MSQAIDRRRRSGSWDRHQPAATNNNIPSGPPYRAPRSGQSFAARTAGDSPLIPDYAPQSRRPTSQSYSAGPSQDGVATPNTRKRRKSGNQTYNGRATNIDATAAANASRVPPNLYVDPSDPRPRSNTKLYNVRGQDRPTIEIPASQPYDTGVSPISPSHSRDRFGAHASGSEARRASIPDRSPLQKLEVKLDDISKEEKRARVEEAEHQARQRREAAQNPQQKFQDAANRLAQPRQVSGPESERATTLPRRTTDARRNVSMPSAGLVDASHPEKGVMDFGGQPWDPQAHRQLHQQQVQRPQQTRYYSSESRHRRLSVAQQAQLQQQQIRDPAPYQDVTSGTVQRSSSNSKYRHRTRDAGFAGAAAAANVGLDETAKGKDDVGDPPVSPNSTSSMGRSNSLLSRTGSKKLQKRSTAQAAPDYTNGNRHSKRASTGQEQLQTDRMGSTGGVRAARQHQEPDVLPRDEVDRGKEAGSRYEVPPQTAGAVHAREQVGFGSEDPAVMASIEHQGHHHRGVRDMLHRRREVEERRYEAPKPLDEWRRAGTARLGSEDLALESDSSSEEAKKAWWGRGGPERRSSGSRQPSAYDGAYEELATETSFRPPLYLKCGPLLRYTGLRRERPSRAGANGAIMPDREIWRGSVMIVTTDAQSSYETPPILRLFAQPMDLLPPSIRIASASSHEPAAEHVDSLAGQVKVGRTGTTLFVKPAEELQPEIDLSRVEKEHGLFGSRRRPLTSATAAHYDAQHDRNASSHGKSRMRKKDGEKLGRYGEVKAARLHAERGVTFWRFNLEIDLGHHQTRVAYRINRGPAIGFWVPGRSETMNAMFHSCNGFSLSVDSNLFSGPDPMWRDVLNNHQSRPFHVMLGGGDQIYNDAAMRDTTLFKEWLATKNPAHKYSAQFTLELQDELKDFYLNRYAMWFSQGLFGLANSQIPMINMWDDHDIIDGYGSYPHHFMSTNIFTGIGAVAFKYYMLFQHQSVPDEVQKDEPSWLLGASPGPYINQLSRSIFMFLGRKVAFLGLDCRTERMRDEILSQETYDLVFDRCRSEIVKGETKHLVVLLGVPIAYPRLNFLENTLTSRLMDPIKALGRAGKLGGFVNKFDGGVEILDDLDDHWTAKHHKAERNWLIQELQELAAEKSVRVTILGGDVHLGAVGQFYSNKKLGIPKDQDHRYMPNVISSAIVNTPPPPLMGDILNKRNKTHHLDEETDEDMIPMFDHDVDGSKRNNLHLLARRNWCAIREYIPGATPPSTPPLVAGQTPNLYREGETPGQSSQRPGQMRRRTLSMTRAPGALARRLSRSGSQRGPPVSLNQEHARPYSSYEPERSDDGGAETPHQGFPSRDDGATEGSYFPSNAGGGVQQGPVRPSPFHRRPTTMSVRAARKAADKGGPHANADQHETSGHIDLQYGLDITLNVEVSQKDPAGVTVPYRLLVPALWYKGPGDVNTASFRGKGEELSDRLGLHGRNKRASHVESPRESPAQTPQALPGRDVAYAAGGGGATVAAGPVTRDTFISQIPTAHDTGARGGVDVTGAYDSVHDDHGSESGSEIGHARRRYDEKQDREKPSFMERMGLTRGASMKGRRASVSKRDSHLYPQEHPQAQPQSQPQQQMPEQTSRGPTITGTAATAGSVFASQNSGAGAPASRAEYDGTHVDEDDYSSISGSETGGARQWHDENPEPSKRSFMQKIGLSRSGSTQGRRGSIPSAERQQGPTTTPFGAQFPTMAQQQQPQQQQRFQQQQQHPPPGSFSSTAPKSAPLSPPLRNPNPYPPVSLRTYDGTFEDAGYRRYSSGMDQPRVAHGPAGNDVSYQRATKSHARRSSGVGNPLRQHGVTGADTGTGTGAGGKARRWSLSNLVQRSQSQTRTQPQPQPQPRNQPKAVSRDDEGYGRERYGSDSPSATDTDSDGEGTESDHSSDRNTGVGGGGSGRGGGAKGRGDRGVGSGYASSAPPARGVRRGSKAEQFFGVGVGEGLGVAGAGAGGGAGGGTGGVGEGMGKGRRKSGWKIWR